MSQTAFTIRIDSDIKQKFDKLCEDFGMSANTAFNVFARTVVKQERLPFEVESEKETKRRLALEAMELIRSDAIRNGTADMSLDEINAIISETRKTMNQ